jgi:sigma-B regulation protein RsbQ
VQSRQDAIAPPFVGEYVRDRIPGASYALLDAVGHCPHLSAPEATVDAMRAFLRS